MRSAGSSTRVAYDRTQDSVLQSQYLPPGQGSATSYPGHHNSQDRLTEIRRADGSHSSASKSKGGYDPDLGLGFMTLRGK